MGDRDNAPGRVNDSHSYARRRGQDGTGRGNARPVENCTTARLFGFGFTPRELERAERVAREAVCWTRANAAAWSYMRSEVARCVEIGKRVAVRALVEAVRSGEATGRPVEVNNSVSPVLARLLVETVPGASLRIERRRSALDVLDLRGIFGGVL